MPHAEWTAGEKKQDIKGRKALSPTAVQCIVCALLLAAAFGLYRNGGTMFDLLRAQYHIVTAQDYCADGVWTAATELAHTVAQQPDEETSAVQTTATIDERAQIETVSSAGGEDIRILDALQGASFDAVSVSQKCVMPVQGKVTSGFGYRVHPVTGKRSFHTGIDLAAAEGTPIVAAYSGDVAQTDYSSGRGNYLRLQHSENLETLYCHLSEILVHEGEHVEAGDVIGLVGSTGMSTGPHLHFELWIGGIRCNPVYVLENLEYA